MAVPFVNRAAAIRPVNILAIFAAHAILQNKGHPIFTRVRISIDDAISVIRMQTALPPCHGALELTLFIAEGFVYLAVPIDAVRGGMEDIEQVARVGGHLAVA